MSYPERSICMGGSIADVGTARKDSFRSGVRIPPRTGTFGRIIIMANKEVAGGVVHKMPEDCGRPLLVRLRRGQYGRTLRRSRNEWIGWVTSGKKAETRDIRIKKGLSKLKGGMCHPAAGKLHSSLNGRHHRKYCQGPLNSIVATIRALFPTRVADSPRVRSNDKNVRFCAVCTVHMSEVYFFVRLRIPIGVSCTPCCDVRRVTRTRFAQSV